jgi:hypothetical protein
MADHTSSMRALVTISLRTDAIDNLQICDFTLGCVHVGKSMAPSTVPVRQRRRQGAELTLCSEPTVLIEADDLSAAILDYRIGDGDSSLLCQRLKERSVPFLMYSGYTEFSGACRDDPRLPKPTTDAVLVATLEGLLQQR